MREGITDVDFIKTENLEIFHNRVKIFVHDNISEGNDISDLYKGFVVHLLSDEMFLINVRPDFVVEMKALGIEPTDILFRDKILDDLDSHDFKLLDNHREMKDVLNSLRNVEPYSINDYITDKEIKLGINWVLEKNLYEEHETSEPIYIPYKKILTYIDESAYDIIDRLSDGIIFPKIF